MPKPEAQNLLDLLYEDWDPFAARETARRVRELAEKRGPAVNRGLVQAVHIPKEQAERFIRRLTR